MNPEISFVKHTLFNLNIDEMNADVKEIKCRHSVEQLRGEISHGFVPKRNSPYPSFPDHPGHAKILSQITNQ